jgi:hypothetical protein
MERKRMKENKMKKKRRKKRRRKRSRKKLNDLIVFRLIFYLEHILFLFNKFNFLGTSI